MKKFLATICAALMLTGCGDEKISQEVTWGRADAKEIDINSKIPGRVVKLLVAEGDTVHAGQIIAYIDQRDLLAQKLQLEANIAAIEAQQVEAAALTEMQRGTTTSALAQAQVAENLPAQIDFRIRSGVGISDTVRNALLAEHRKKHIPTIIFDADNTP